MNRSVPQNSSMWGLTVSDAAKFYQYNPTAYLSDMSRMIGLPLDDGIIEILKRYIVTTNSEPNITNGMVHAMLKAMFNNGRTTRFVDSVNSKGEVTKTGMEKMNAYMDKVHEHFLFVWKKDLRRPNTPVIEGMGV